MMHLTKNIIKIVARVVNNCYLLAERVREPVTVNKYYVSQAKTLLIDDAICYATKAFIRAVSNCVPCAGKRVRGKHGCFGLDSH